MCQRRLWRNLDYFAEGLHSARQVSPTEHLDITKHLPGFCILRKLRQHALHQRHGAARRTRTNQQASLQQAGAGMLRVSDQESIHDRP